ncbi:MULTISPECIES: hypothetical protein [Paraburkholderia]|jgi:hypothetical protein|uniref:Lipoprotein n=1 Tax=Paraburkholderia phenazinium TaxID=60549 RepID=A0A1N6L3D3_9BURK|nr:hypothetical protein [Paraburkholderia phenazinium]SIO63275.1 hypothetical protein SAMN05444165_5789 [Paraburkholderia phenazinium]
MKQLIERAATVGTICVSVLLSACSGSPSEGDVRAALQKQVEAGRAQAEQLMGKSAFLDKQIDQQKQAVDGIKLIGCKNDGDKAYVCDLESNGGASRVRMLKGSDGWIASDVGKG